MGVVVLQLPARGAPDHRRRFHPAMSRTAGIAVVAAASAAAIVPTPRAFVERWYSSGLFPVLQRALTACSNLVPIALFDVLCLAALCVAAVSLMRAIRARGWRRGVSVSLWRGLVA